VPPYQKSQKLPRWRWTIEHWSASRIQQWHQCPRKFEYAVVQELDVPVNAYLVFGRLIHGHLARFFKPLLTKDGPKPRFKNREHFVDQGAHLWGKVVSGGCGPEGFGSKPVQIRWLTPRLEEQLWERLWPLLNGFWRDNHSYLDLEETNQWLYPTVEKRIEAELPSFRLGRPHRVLGVIDRIQPVPGRGREIWDNKIGKDLEWEEGLRLDIQMMLYEILFWKEFGKYPDAIKLYHPQYGMSKGLVQVPFSNTAKARAERLEQVVVWLDEATEGVLEVLDPQALFHGQAMPSKFLEPGTESRFIRYAENRKCFFCDYGRICFGDHFHGSTKEYEAIVEEESRKLAPPPAEQLKLEIEAPQRSSLRSIWKRQLTLMVKKQRKAAESANREDVTLPKEDDRETTTTPVSAEGDDGEGRLA
jgi:hypothetical protein